MNDIARLRSWLSWRLDELLTLAYLMLLLGLGLWRDAPLFEDIRSSALAWRTLQIFGMLLIVGLVWAPSSIRRLLANWLPFVLALMTYEGLKHMHATALTMALGISPIDPLLRNIDLMLFGALAHEIMGNAIGEAMWIKTLLKCFYIFYYFMPGIVLAMLYFWRNDRGFAELRRGVLICLYGGYLMYILLPAAGPNFDLAMIGASGVGTLHAYQYALTHLRYQFDCFPSLHTALPWTVVGMSWVHVPGVVRAFLVFCAAGSTLATVGLGFHYGIDVLAGLLWSVVTMALAKWTMWSHPRVVGDMVPPPARA
jgi:hypothetical protein